MSKGFKSGGGGNPLNFKIVGGTAQPVSPRENTIWVYTEFPVTGWEFSTVRPVNTAEGMVWFGTGDESTAPFNALKKNTIRLCPEDAMQYQNGVWVDVEAFVFQNGGRVRISDGIVYYILNGTTPPDYNGGWKGVGTAEVSTSPMTTGYVSVRTDGTTSGRVVMDTPISAFGKYKTLTFVGNGSKSARFIICGSSGEIVSTSYFLGGSYQETHSVDISNLSKDETYFCGLYIPGTGSAAFAKVLKIWLE